MPKYSLPNNVHSGGSICTLITFLFVDQSSPPFLHPTWEGSSFINYVSDFRFVDQFRRYLRSKSKVMRNRAEFLTFFTLPNFRGQPFKKVYTCYHPWLATRRLDKNL